MTQVREWIEKNGLPYHFRENVKTGKNEHWWISGCIKSNGEVGKVDASFSTNGWSYGAVKREEPPKVKAAKGKLEKKLKAFREIHEEDILAWIKKEQTPRVIISVHKPRTEKPEGFDKAASILVATHKAAPEMLAALNGLLAYIEKTPEAKTWNSISTPDEIVAAVMAVSKATPNTEEAKGER